MEPILRVQNLTKTFTRSGQSNLTAVNGISFDLLPANVSASSAKAAAERQRR